LIGVCAAAAKAATLRDSASTTVEKMRSMAFLPE
jgi:hypothetical protein